jgi:hypothetical protein
VRTHTGPTAQRVSESLNAAAFASGTDVFFAPGVFQPGDPAGLHVVGHELAHVIQQKYGAPPADAEALAAPSHPAERQAEALATRALDTPMVAPAAGVAESEPAPAQRSALADYDVRLGQWPSPGPHAPEAGQPKSLARASDFSTPTQPLSIASLAGAEPAAPVQRFTTTEFAGLRQSLPGATPLVQAGALGGAPVAAAALAELERTPARVGGLTDQLPNPGGMLTNLNSAARNLPVQPVLTTAPLIMGGPRSDRPVLSRAFDMSALTDSLPALPNVPELPTLDSLDSLGSQAGAPDMTSLGGPLPSVPALSSLRPPEMPLPPTMGDLGQMAAGAAAGGQAALGNVVDAAQSAVEGAAPALPNIDKLTDQIWKSIQQKLRVERERSRGLA